LDEFYSWRVNPCEWKEPIVAAHYVQASEQELMLDIVTRKLNKTCRWKINDLSEH
jgi:hypothetical protein